MPPLKLIKGRNYGSVPHLSDSKIGEHDKYLHFGQEKIIREGGRDRHDEVIVSLKLDGTNVGILKRNGKLITLQRKGYDCKSSPYRQHHEFDTWVQTNKKMFDDLLREGDRIVGEWLWQSSGIIYRVTRPAFFPFDFFPFAEDEKQHLNWSDFTDLIQRKGIPLQLPACKRYQRKETPITKLADLPIFPYAIPISHPSHEGLIFRVERKGQFDFLAKWVRPDYVAGEFLPGLRDNHPTQLVLNELI